MTVVAIVITMTHAGRSLMSSALLGPTAQKVAQWSIYASLLRCTDGSARPVYDFVFGSKTLKRAQTDEQFRLVILQTCYRALEEKLNISLSKSALLFTAAASSLAHGCLTEFSIAKKYAFKAPPERRALVTEIAPVPADRPREPSSTTVARAADYTVSQTPSDSANKFDYHVRIALPKLVRKRGQPGR